MSILPKFTKSSFDQSEAVLREQYVNLRQQVPLMYLLMFVDVAFLSFVTSQDGSPQMSLGVPAALSIMIALRAGAWIRRRHTDVTTDQIRSYLQGTVVAAAVFSLLFGGWGLLLFDGDNPARSTAIALYVFVGAISCCYCLQALPVAARLVLLLGGVPVTFRLFISRDWYLVGVGMTFLLVGVVILRTIATNRSAIFEALRSRSEMSVLLDALRKSEEHYRFSVELNPQIPWTSDPSGQILEVSPRWAALTGVSVNEALGWNWMTSVHPDDLPGVFEQWKAALAEEDGRGADVRYRLRHSDGSFRWCRSRSNPRRDADGQIIAWYGTLEDIHDQITAELALRESEERYRLASRATNDLIWDWSHATNRIEWAGGVTNILGHDLAAENTTMAWWTKHIHPDDLSAVLTTYDRVVNNGLDNWSHEYRFRGPQGTYVHIFSRGYVVRNAEGHAVRSIGALLDVTDAKRADEELRWAAYHDPLTRLPNRKLFSEKLEAALLAAATNATCVGVTVIDVDGFKLINDSLGHAAGDIVLKTVGIRILSNLPGDATIARLGGDEFAVILPGLAPEDACAATVERLLRGVGDAMTIDESVLNISVSAGAAMWPMDGNAAEDVLKSADLALYAAKADGSGTARGFRPAMREAVERRKTMIRDAREALHDDRIIPFYQPKVDLSSGEIVGFEALLRWHHHRRGLQPPHTIQAAFEDSSLSPQLTDRMIDRVLADMTVFTDQGRAFGRIAINASSGDFRRDDFADRILDKFHNARLSPSLLELEVTETVFLEQIACNVERALRTLAAEGATIALDDFGTGYASLTHLQQFPVHVLKIDRSFISRLDGMDSADFAIVHGVIDIAHKMNIMTVAEGVENGRQAEHLHTLGCDIGQGFLFGRAISAARVPVWMDDWSQNKSADKRWSADHHPDVKGGTDVTVERGGR